LGGLQTEGSHSSSSAKESRARSKKAAPGAEAADGALDDAKVVVQIREAARPAGVDRCKHELEGARGHAVILAFDGAL
jgi:hypothetical protein